MTDYGVTDAGFTKKSLETITDEIGEDLKSDVNPKLNVLATALAGQLIGVIGAKLSELWDVAEAIYRSRDPDNATKDGLDQILALTGFTREHAEQTEVTLDRMVIEDGYSAPEGGIVSIGETGAQFALIAAVTNNTGFTQLMTGYARALEYGAIAAYALSINRIVSGADGWYARAAMVSPNDENYAVGGLSIRFWMDDDEHDDVIAFTAGGPYTAQECADMINDTAQYCKAYDANGYLMVVSLTDGTTSAIRASSTGGANAVFDFPIVNTTSGMNSADGAPGRNIELDDEARLRRELLLRATGSATVQAVRNKLIDLDYMVQCRVYENDTDIVVDGMPPHSIEALVRFEAGGEGDEGQEIAELIFANKGGGIQTTGNQSRTVVDAEGISHVVYYSIPTDVPIYIEMTVQVIAADFPADGEEQITNAILAMGADTTKNQIGSDVIALRYRAIPMDVTGVYDVSAFAIGIAPGPTLDDNIVIDLRSLASFSSTNIALTIEEVEEE